MPLFLCVCPHNKSQWGQWYPPPLQGQNQLKHSSLCSARKKKVSFKFVRNGPYEQTNGKIISRPASKARDAFEHFYISTKSSVNNKHVWNHSSLSV